MLSRLAARIVAVEELHATNNAPSHCRTQFVCQVPQSRPGGSWIVESPETARVQPIDEIFESCGTLLRNCEGTVGFLEVAHECCFEEIGSTADEALVEIEAMFFRNDEHDHHSVVKATGFQSA